MTGVDRGRLVEVLDRPVEPAHATKHDPLIGQDVRIVGAERQGLAVGLDRLDRLIAVSYNFV